MQVGEVKVHSKVLCFEKNKISELCMVISKEVLTDVYRLWNVRTVNCYIMLYNGQDVGSDGW